MSASLFDPGREGFALAEIDWDTATIKASIVRGYTFTASHKFVSDLTGAGGTLVATTTLASVTGTAGVLNASNLTFTAVTAGAACQGIVVYQSSAVGGGADVASSAQRLILYYDGIFSVTAAVTAATSATSITVDPLVTALASGSTIVFGAVTATLTASAALGARSVTVSALSGGVTQGTVGTTSAQGGFPFTPNGTDVTVAWDATNKIAKL